MLGKFLELTVLLIISIFFNIWSLSIIEAGPDIVFKINAGLDFLFLNVSKNILTKPLTSFLS